MNENHISSRVLSALLAGLALDSQHKYFPIWMREERSFILTITLGSGGEVLQFQDLWRFSFLGMKDGQSDKSVARSFCIFITARIFNQSLGHE